MYSGALKGLDCGILTYLPPCLRTAFPKSDNFATKLPSTSLVRSTFAGLTSPCRISSTISVQHVQNPNVFTCHSYVKYSKPGQDARKASGAHEFQQLDLRKIGSAPNCLTRIFQKRELAKPPCSYQLHPSRGL